MKPANIPATTDDPVTRRLSSTLSYSRRWRTLTARLAVLAICLSVSSSGTAATPKQLNLFIWSEYIDPAIVKAFEQKFGAKVVLDTYESNESMLAKLQAGGARYDVALPSDYILPLMIAAKLVRPLDQKHIPNLVNLEKRFRDTIFDPKNTYSAAYQWGSSGLAYRSDRIKIADSWEAIFGAKDIGRFALLDDPRDVIGAALKYLGYSLNSTNPGELAKARDLLIRTKQKRGFIGFDGGPGVRNKLLAGEIDFGQIYSGDALQGTAENKALVYTIPKEGTPTYADLMVVLSGSANPSLAESFINFVLEPRNHAAISNYTMWASPNAASLRYIAPIVRNNPGIYPPANVLSRLEPYRDLGAASRLYDRLWTEIKAR